MKLLIAFSLLAFMISCNNNKSSENQSEGTSDSTNANTTTDDKYISTTPVTRCYEWTNKNDSTYLKVTYMDNRVTGDLVYDWSEKDNNTGVINGMIKDNVILAWYTFQSEGVTSVRQVAFKIEDDELIEGFGDLLARGDTMTFKNIETLKFDKQNAYFTINCR